MHIEDHMPLHNLPLLSSVGTSALQLNQDILYSSIVRRYLEWPCTCARFGLLTSTQQNYSTLKFFVSYRTDSDYNRQARSWSKHGSSIMVGSLQLPDQGKAFIEEYEGFYGTEEYKRKRNGITSEIEFEQILVHENEVNRIEVCDKEPKFISSSGNSSKIYIWNILKQKPKSSQSSKDRHAANISDYQ